MANTLLWLYDNDHQNESFKQALKALPYRLVGASLDLNLDEQRALFSTGCPQMMSISCAVVNRTLLAKLNQFVAWSQCPVVIFCRDNDPLAMERALKAGVASYIVDLTDLNRLASIFLVAQCRYRIVRTMSQTIIDAKNQLSERKTIERAKAFLMATEKLSEPQSYALMRQTAMNNNETIKAVALRLLSRGQMPR